MTCNNQRPLNNQPTNQPTKHTKQKQKATNAGMWVRVSTETSNGGRGGEGGGGEGGVSE